MSARPATMTALRWHAAHDVRIESVPVPTPPPGCSLVEVTLCGLCGTDLHEYRHGPHMIRPTAHPLTGQRPPVTLGHEFAGRIVQTTADSPALDVGTRVTADACWRCMACAQCLAGDYHLCRFGGSIGLHSDGAFAPYVVVPDYCLVALPDTVSDRAAALVEPFAVALHGLERGGLRGGDDVVVLGFGPIGAAAALVARALGARVHVVERSAARAAEAERLGLPLIEAGDELPRRVRATLRSGGADLVVESTGVGALLPDAIRSTGRGGRIVQVGMGGPPATIALEQLVLHERSLVGSLGYRHHLPAVVRMVQTGALDPEVLISDVVPLARADDLVASMAADPGGRIKVLVDVR